MSSFDKSKPLHFVADNGKKSDLMMLTKDNDWSINSFGIEFYWENMHTIIPWTSIIKVWQFKKESDGKAKKVYCYPNGHAFGCECQECMERILNYER